MNSKLSGFFKELHEILNYQFLSDILPEGLDNFRADVLLVDLTFDLNPELLPRHCLLETRTDFPTESYCFRRMTEQRHFLHFSIINSKTNLKYRCFLN